MQATKFVAIIGLVTLAWLAPSHARQLIEKTQNICAEAVRKAERKNAIPTHLLSAISLAESGRWNAEKQANIAWPWTVTSGGEGQFFKSKAEALAEVEFLRTDGVTNIDVGCMQINLHHHPNAFRNLNVAFDPTRNVAYAAHMLSGHYRQTGDWKTAVAHYH
ncbi:MAG: transglycosylase SLT domain-containing protein, partial [Rhodospirillaceae bacterium]|nr:transglycosylase SLT domain-containing protein [Rhodospirillaceae bacterium]